MVLHLSAFFKCEKNIERQKQKSIHRIRQQSKNKFQVNLTDMKWYHEKAHIITRMNLLTCQNKRRKKQEH